MPSTVILPDSAPPRAPENGYQRLAGIPAKLWAADLTEEAAYWLAVEIEQAVERATCCSKAERTARRHGPAANRADGPVCRLCGLSHREGL